MAVMHSYYCKHCDLQISDMWEPPVCCGDPMRIDFVQVNTPEWGGPKQFLHLRDEPFSSRSELNRYAEKNNLRLSPSAEKHGGARNEEMLNLGTKYSYKGSPKS